MKTKFSCSTLPPTQHHSTTLSLEIRNFFSTALWTIIYLTCGCFHLQRTIHHNKGTKRPPSCKISLVEHCKRDVHRNGNGKHGVWWKKIIKKMQHNLDDLPQNTVNRNGGYKLSKNNRSKIPFPSNNNNYDKEDNNNCCFCQKIW